MKLTAILLSVALVACNKPQAEPMIGEKPFSAWVAQLDDLDTHTKLVALSMIGHADAEHLRPLAPRFEAFAADKHQTVYAGARSAAILSEKLNMPVPSEAIGSLLFAIESEDIPELQTMEKEALAKIARVHPEVSHAIVERMLSGVSRSYCSDLAGVIEEIGEPALPELQTFDTPGATGWAYACISVAIERIQAKTKNTASAEKK